MKLIINYYFMRMRPRFFLFLIPVLFSLTLLWPRPSQATTLLAVDLRIQTSSETIFDQEVYLTDEGCTVTDSAGVDHTITGAKAICVLAAGGDTGQFEYSLENYSGIGLFLDSVNNYVTDSVNYSEYWSFFMNDASADVGLSDYTVENGDAVLLSFGPYATDALRVHLPDNEVLAGQKIHARVQALVVGTQSIFAPVAGATLQFDDGQQTLDVITDAFGKASFTPDPASSAVTLYATKAGAVRSVTTTVLVFDVHTKTDSINSNEQRTMAEAGVDLIKSDIGDNGQIFGNLSLTEWGAMALGAADTSADRLVDAVRAYDPAVSGGANELSRHILALVAIGDDPRNVNGVDYVDRLLKTKSDKQFGNTAFINDDIFAGLALLAVGEAGNSNDVNLVLRAAKAGINQDGGVSYAASNTTSDVDTTAFFLQFVYAAKQAGNTVPITRARQAALHFIRTQQNLDGGFGYSALEHSNSASTAVVLAALQSASRNPNSFRRNKRTAYNYLAAVQKDSGVFAYSTSVNSSYDVLNTAYAVIALFHKSLPVLY